MKLNKDDLIARKVHGPKIGMLTSYDFPTAQLLDKCGVDVQLVGDSVGTNILGYSNISEVTVADIAHHLRAVVRGVQNSFLLVDMPFGSCSSNESALKNAKLFIEEGADGVKIETEHGAIEKISHVASTGIPVCAHIGYTPQTPGMTVSVQGKDVKRASELIQLAQESEKAGAFMIVLELMPEKLAKLITEVLSIPTIGIGAGRFCDGQVQVILDILGFSGKVFRHVKKYADVPNLYTDAITSFISDVQNGYFPAEKNGSALSEEVMKQISHYVDSKRTV